jgi:signal transduction histidine kinase
MARLFSALRKRSLHIPSLHIRSLRVQVFLWTIAPLTILLILFSLTGIGTHQASMRQLAGEENKRLLAVMAQALASQVESKTASMQAAAELLGHDYGDAAMRNAHLQTASRVLAGSDLVLLDANGAVLGAAPTVPAWLQNLNTELLPVAPLAAASALTVTQAPGETPGEALVLWRVAVPGQPAWLLAGEPVAALVQSSGLKLDEAAHAGVLVLVDHAGRILYQLGDDSGVQALAASAARYGDQAVFERVGGEEYAITAAGVPQVDWRLILREPWHGLSTPPILLEQLTPFVVLIAVVISFLTLLFGLLFVVRPLRLLSDRMRRIGEGDFAAAGVKVGGVDEIEELRQAVDQMAQQIQGYQAGLQSYLHAVTRAQEEERARLARELHDETIQTLTALDHKVQKSQRALEQEPAQLPQNLAELHRMVAGATAEVRRFSRALRPLYLEDLGLAPALELLAKESGAGFTLGGAPRRIAPEVELALYRIAQESLSNARRHAQATQVEVTLVFGPHHVRLTISDDGRGFDLPADLSALARSGHFGLMSMQERAQLVGAHLSLETAPEQGTSVTVTVTAATVSAG